MSMLEAIGKPMAISSEEEMEEDKEEEQENEERYRDDEGVEEDKEEEQDHEERRREDEGVEEKERKVYKVLGRLTAQGKSYLVDEDELRRRVKGENMSTNMFRMLIRVFIPIICIHLSIKEDRKSDVVCHSAPHGY